MYKPGNVLQKAGIPEYDLLLIFDPSPLPVIFPVSPILPGIPLPPD